jgi:hypothetical protein
LATILLVDSAFILISVTIGLGVDVGVGVGVGVGFTHTLFTHFPPDNRQPITSQGVDIGVGVGVVFTRGTQELLTQIVPGRSKQLTGQSANET